VKVVIDANVLVSAAIGTGPSQRVVAVAMSSPRLTAVVCPTLLAEVDNVLSRPRLQERLPEEARSVYLRDLASFLDVVPDPAVVPATTRDPEDDYLVALARENGVDWIVSGDKDLLEWEEQRPPVLPPAAFGALLRSEGLLGS